MMSREEKREEGDGDDLAASWQVFYTPHDPIVRQHFYNTCGTYLHTSRATVNSPLLVEKHPLRLTVLELKQFISHAAD
jgi:hypothetical protein